MDDPSRIRKYGVLGWPIEHSLSPVMHRAAFGVLGIRAVYEKIPVPPGELANTVSRMIQEGFEGWNITVPYKEEIIPLVKVAGVEAQAARSVNTVIVKGGCLLGYSTDGFGVEQALRREFGFNSQPANQLFLGAGGAARAAAVYAARHGATEIAIANRTPVNAERLSRVIHAAAPQCRVRVIPLADCAEMRTALAAAGVVFQCTSLGLRPDDPMPVPVSIIPTETPVFDFVYSKTRFKDELAARGNRVADGLEMLIQQGARSFELWTGMKAPVEAMRQSLRQKTIMLAASGARKK